MYLQDHKLSAYIRKRDRIARKALANKLYMFLVSYALSDDSLDSHVPADAAKLRNRHEAVRTTLINLCHGAYHSNNQLFMLHVVTTRQVTNRLVLEKRKGSWEWSYITGQSEPDEMVDLIEWFVERATATHA